MQNLRRHRVESRDRLAVPLSIIPQEMLCQQLNIFAPFPQRRQMNLDRIQPKQQILPKSPRSLTTPDWDQ